MSNIILDCNSEAQIRAAWNAIPNNVIESGDTFEILLDKPEIFLNDSLNFDGKITGPNNRIVLASASGKSYTDNPDMQNTPFTYSADNGAALRIHGSYRKYMMRINVPYMTLRGIQLFQSGTNTETALTVVAGGADLFIDRCIIDSAGELRYCRTIGAFGAKRMRMVSSLVVHRSNLEMAMYLDSRTSSFENVTFVRPSNFTENGNAVNVIGGDNDFVNCNAVGFELLTSNQYARVKNCANPGQYNYGTGMKNGVASADQVVSTLNDFRTKPTSVLVDAGVAPSADNAAAPNGNRQQGTATDIGAWEKPSTSVAPTAKITSVVISGTNKDIVTITGVTTGTPTSGEMSIVPVDVPYNKAVTQGPVAVTFTANAFSVQFQSTKVGIYSMVMPVRNMAFSTSATNEFGNFEIAGAGALTVVQEPMSGQMYTLRGTTFGNPTSGEVYVPPAATNPAGAVGQVIPLVLTAGAFTASKGLPAGNYDAGLLTFTNAQGTSFPQPGTTAVSVLGFTGNPEAPADGEVTPTPNPVVESVTISPTTATGSTKFTGTAVGTNNPPQTFIFTAEKGTIDSEGNFVAPAKTSSVQVFAVTVKSTIAPTKMATATVTIAAADVVVPPTPVVTGVSITPLTATSTGQPIQLTAVVMGANNPDQGVTWTPANNVSASGLVTPPAATSVVQTLVVRATSTVNDTKYGEMTITIPALVVVVPDPEPEVPTGRATKATLDMVSPEGVPQVNLTGLSVAFFDQTDIGDLLAPVARTKTGSTNAQGQLEMNITGTLLVPGQSGRIIVSKGTKAFTGIVVVS